MMPFALGRPLRLGIEPLPGPPPLPPLDLGELEDDIDVLTDWIIELCKEMHERGVNSSDMEALVTLKGEYAEKLRLAAPNDCFHIDIIKCTVRRYPCPVPGFPVGERPEIVTIVQPGRPQAVSVPAPEPPPSAVPPPEPGPTLTGALLGIEPLPADKPPFPSVDAAEVEDRMAEIRDLMITLCQHEELGLSVAGDRELFKDLKEDYKYFWAISRLPDQCWYFDPVTCTFHEFDCPIPRPQISQRPGITIIQVPGTVPVPSVPPPPAPPPQAVPPPPPPPPGPIMTGR